MTDKQPIKITRKVRINIDKLLKDRGLTQKELSDLTDVRQAAISNLRRGFVDRISIDHMERIASALNIDDINDIISLTPADNKGEQ